ncbi:MAG: carboxypeptidase regulatory-like domain-containing protein [Ignavibacteriae bacterium]|nr:carboxypeptidase regulatory-like domain-containing protein [Ignavibacteriota bacterium]MCB9216045.1 carboxypeptidase regulatory-like domain-containing protein [Ignavibacteria bacterium]
MKTSQHYSYPLLFVLTLITLTTLSSCGSDPSDPGNRLTGVLTGKVIVYDQYGNKEQDLSGVKVEVDGTSYKGISEQDGYWHIENLPAGTYVITMSKDGYSQYKYYAYPFVGGGEGFLNETAIYQIPTYKIESLWMGYVDTTTRRTDTLVYDSATGKAYHDVKDTLVSVEPYFVAYGRMNQPPPVNNYQSLILFSGRNPDVSSAPGKYEHLEILRSESESQDFDFKLNVTLTYYSAGETIYLRAYPIASAAYGSYYSNPLTGERFLLGLSEEGSQILSVVKQ